MSGYLRRDENAAALAAARAELFSAPTPPRVFRQRYQCTCGWHGTREEFAPPSHIRCARCDGVAVARDPAELVR